MKFTLSNLTMAIIASNSVVAAASTCNQGNQNEPVEVEKVSVAAKDVYDFTFVFDLWSSILGGENNGTGPAPVKGVGYRRINWDAAALPFDMPGNFFSADGFVDRGLTIVSETGDFAVSNDGVDDLFDSIDDDTIHKEDLTTFSPPRLFSPINENEFKMTFNVPGSTKQGLISAFGIFFVDVEEADETTLTFYDENDCEIVSASAEPNPGGLSFLGLKLHEKIVASVEVKAGTKVLGDVDKKAAPAWRRALAGAASTGAEKKEDFVAMDDFIFDEPLGLHDW